MNKNKEKFLVLKNNKYIKLKLMYFKNIKILTMKHINEKKILYKKLKY